MVNHKHSQSNMPSTYIFIPVSFCILIIATSLCSAADTISAGQTLAGRGGKLVSKNGKFALGFFQRSTGSRSSTPKWYLGIWFNTVPKLTPAWVANRENPLLDGTSSELIISDDGNLAIFNRPNRSILWSSQANTTTNNTIAVLLNSRDLVLSDASNSTTIFWRSFDHMTDTFLPGARVSRNKVTGWTHGLVSNKNSHDLSPGIYSGRPSPESANFELLLSWNSSVTYWSSGQWEGQYFSNMPEMSARYLFFSEFVSNDREEYYTYWLKNETMVTRYVLDVDGQAKMMLWSDASAEWIFFYPKPGAQCEAYAVCGPFTVCREDVLPFCNCMKGFSIRSQEDWELGDRTGGCNRNIPLNCASSNSGISGDLTDMFYAMRNVIYPDNAKHIETGSAEECEKSCLGDCSCYAYSYSGTCSVWNSELLNVVQRYNGSASEGILYLRLAAEELKTSKHRRGMIVRLVIAATIFAALSLFAIICMFFRRRKRQHSSMEPSNIRGGIMAFGYKDLQHATKNFSEKLGGGSFGSVFKGVLPDSTVIAVKRLDGARQGEKEFRAEVSSIGMIQHINLVKLIGFCCQGSKRLLVYEYMPNHSLDAHLFQSSGMPLCWGTRYKIALGVARGLAYLHENCQDCIIHCDIKPQNILLDASFVPKIADFGMAKFVRRDFSRAITTMRGTIGYLAPEWISGVAISSKVDVYSYGMVLLEIIFGRRNSGEEYNSDSTYLPVQVVNKLLQGNVQCLVDESMHDGINLEEVERACRVACWCIQDHESRRLTMGEVVRILEGLIKVDVPPMPKVLEAISGGTDSTIA
ncbi:G-type lectin S-receptor-like serine/threonine-protein kinase At2g19130 [Setaria italica]|nr:G-type lectin S-receptor-like serine/threonine-protein kinase At2g19130 [Setaria italica]